MSRIGERLPHSYISREGVHLERVRNTLESILYVFDTLGSKYEPNKPVTSGNVPTKSRIKLTPNLTNQGLIAFSKCHSRK